MNTPVLVPTVPSQKIRAWPKYLDGGTATHVALGQALTREYRTDAHFAQYSVPSLGRRLDSGALAPSALESLGGAIAMVVVAFDVDAASSHKALGGTGDTPASDEWWLAELAKLERLLEEHPGLFVYRTRGGYRILGILPAPLLLRGQPGAMEWKLSYLGSIAYLRRGFEIVADPVADWTRLFRLPHATREGSVRPERRETIGDPSGVGAWTPELALEDREYAAAHARKPEPRPRKERADSAAVYSGEGTLFHALKARGAIRSQLEPGKWAITCPKESEHSKGGETSTILYAPGAGETFGWPHCSHSGSGHDRFTLATWLACFDQAELDAARAAAGVVDHEAKSSSSSSTAVSMPVRPVIQIGTNIRANADALIAALAGADVGLYQRDGELVHVTHTAESESDVDEDGRGMWRAGSPRVRIVAPANLTERAATVAEWLKFDRRSEDWRPALPPSHVVGAVSARGEWKDIRPLVSVSECPFMRPDGSICSTPGYDRPTGVLLEPSITLEPIPEQVTIGMAREAWATLSEPFEEFPWATPAASSAAIAAVLTMIARPAIRGSIPAVIFDKNTPGTGGTLGADVVSIIATGRTAPRLSWPPNDEELEKVLGALALGAANLVVFDNIRRAFTGGPLDKVLTADDRVQLRVLGVSEVPTLQWRALVMGSGNNVAISSDTIDRVLVARMETALENPRERTGFKIGDLRAWTRKHRAELVRAALVVLRGFVCAGRPSQGLKSWGSFEAFAALVPPAIVFAGGADPMGARLRADSAGDPEMAAYSVLLRRLPDICPDGTSLRALVALLYPLERQRGERCAPDEWDDLREALEALAPIRGGVRAVDPHRLGNTLRPWCGRVVGGRKLSARPDRNGIGVWRVERLGAGTAGTAGTLPTSARENGKRIENDFGGNGLDKSQQYPQSPHVGSWGGGAPPVAARMGAPGRPGTSFGVGASSALAQAKHADNSGLSDVECEVWG